MKQKVDDFFLCLKKRTRRYLTAGVNTPSAVKSDTPTIATPIAIIHKTLECEICGLTNWYKTYTPPSPDGTNMNTIEQKVKKRWEETPVQYYLKRKHYVPLREAMSTMAIYLMQTVIVIAQKTRLNAAIASYSVGTEPPMRELQVYNGDVPISPQTTPKAESIDKPKEAARDVNKTDSL